MRERDGFKQNLNRGRSVAGWILLWISGWHQHHHHRHRHPQNPRINMGSYFFSRLYGVRNALCMSLHQYHAIPLPPFSTKLFATPDRPSPESVLFKSCIREEASFHASTLSTTSTTKLRNYNNEQKSKFTLCTHLIFFLRYVCIVCSMVVFVWKECLVPLFLYCIHSSFLDFLSICTSFCSCLSAF